MKAVLTLTLILAVVVFAVIGTLTIIGLMSLNDAVTLLLKAEAVIIFLGGCSALLVKLTSNRK